MVAAWLDPSSALQGMWLARLIYSAQLTKNCSVIHTYRTKDTLYVHSTVTFTVCKQCDRVATQITTVILSTCTQLTSHCCSFLKSTCKTSGRLQKADSKEDTCYCPLSGCLKLYLHSQSNWRCRTKRVWLARLTAESVGVETETFVGMESRQREDFCGYGNRQRGDFRGYRDREETFHQISELWRRALAVLHRLDHREPRESLGCETRW